MVICLAVCLHLENGHTATHRTHHKQQARCIEDILPLVVESVLRNDSKSQHLNRPRYVLWAWPPSPRLFSTFHGAYCFAIHALSSLHWLVCLVEFLHVLKQRINFLLPLFQTRHAYTFILEVFPNIGLLVTPQLKRQDRDRL